MYCGNCGKEVAEGSKFCLNCGAPMIEEGAAETAAQEKLQEAREEIAGAAEAYAEGALDEAQLAEQEARRVEEEAKAAIEKAQAEADEARAKAEAQIAEAREKARLAAMAKAEAEATSLVGIANGKIANAKEAQEKYINALDEAKTAYEAANNSIAAAQALGVTGLPELSSFIFNEAATQTTAPQTNVCQERTRVEAVPAIQALQPAETQIQAQPQGGKLLRPWAYFLLDILYCIPVIGWIFLIVHTFGKKNMNRRYYAISRWIYVLITLIFSAILLLLFVIFRQTELGEKLVEFWRQMVNNATSIF